MHAIMQEVPNGLPNNITIDQAFPFLTTEKFEIGRSPEDDELVCKACSPLDQVNESAGYYPLIQWPHSKDDELIAE
jgi:hypothetical protein